MPTKQSSENPRASIWGSVGANVTAAIGGLITAIFLARFYGLEPLGLYFFTLAGAQAISRIPAGISAALRKQIRKRNQAKSKYIGLGLLISFLWIIFGVGLGGVLYFTNPSIGATQLNSGLWAGFTAVLLGMGIYHILHGAYTATNDTSKSKAARHGLIAIAHIALAIRGYPIEYFLISYGILTALIGMTLIFRLSKPSIPELTTIKNTSTASAKSIPTAIISNFHHKADVLILGIIVGSSAVGLYEVALKLTIPAVLAAGAISSSFAARVTDKNSSYRASELVRSAITYSPVVAFPALAIFTAMSNETLWFIFGPEYNAAWAVLILMSLTQVLSSLRIPFSMALRTSKRKSVVRLVRGGSLLVNIPLSVYLVTSLGVFGVIAATFIVECIMLSIYYVLIKKSISQTIRFNEILEQIVAAGVAFIVVYGILWTGVVVTAGRYLLVFLLGLVVYASLYISLSHRVKSYLLTKVAN